MKIVSDSGRAFLIAGALGGYFREALSLHYQHLHNGLRLPLQDWMYAGFEAILYGVLGGIVGLVVGLALNWFLMASLEETRA